MTRGIRAWTARLGLAVASMANAGSLDTAAVAETRRLGAAPHYVVQVHVGVSQYVKGRATVFGNSARGIASPSGS